MPTLGRRRAYGQHFLKDKSVSGKIAQTAVEAAENLGCATLLEIGPGRGAITDPILELAYRSTILKEIILCEKDRALAGEWKIRADKDNGASDQGKVNANPDKVQDRVQDKVPGIHGKVLTVQDADFLELDQAKWLGHAPLVVASNLPYSAGTAIFTRLAAHPDKIRTMVLMFQAEVAQRLRAEVSTKAWGSLSIWTQNRWDVTKLLTVPPGAFQPPPEVMSEVVVLVPREKRRVEIPSWFINGTSVASGANDNDSKRLTQAEALWESLLKSCFAHRRKMLRAGLPKSGPLRNALESSGVDGTKRAEALEWQEWERLFHGLLRAHQLVK
jgi:16S rRNA (adenine1518-N6/adenine1519-N6)-dimethyltransferase